MSFILNTCIELILAEFTADIIFIVSQSAKTSYKEWTWDDKLFNVYYKGTIIVP